MTRLIGDSFSRDYASAGVLFFVRRKPGRGRGALRRRPRIETNRLPRWESTYFFEGPGAKPASKRLAGCSVARFSPPRRSRRRRRVEDFPGVRQEVAELGERALPEDEARAPAALRRDGGHLAVRRVEGL